MDHSSYSDSISSDNGSLPSWLRQIVGMSMITSYMPGHGSGLMGTLSIFLVGWLLEMGMRAYGWLSERWRFQYSLTAEFENGDPAFDWIMAFLMKQEVWRSAWNFKISAKTLQSKGGVENTEISQGHSIDNADYVPTYQKPQLFRWNGYWVEIKRTDNTSYDFRVDNDVTSSVIYLTVYTRDVSVVSALVEEARTQYAEMTKPHVIIHTSTHVHYSNFHWTDCKRKPRRPLNTVVLESGVMDSLVDDVREFLNLEDWYHLAGIPYRRGYLLYGPPGTGKSSTIYSLAGELGLEIYSLSLSSNKIDDSILAQAVAAIPKRSIFLLEDIDCAFSRDQDKDNDEPFRSSRNSRCSVTLSGLLNTLDGVASQEGILFFATTNHIEDLDSALIRPGRIDRKIQYHYSSKKQTMALFKRFFPISYCTPESAKEGISDEDKAALVDSLAVKLAEEVPVNKFTTAELQGFLLTCKFKPEKAVKEAREWAEKLIAEKEDLEKVKREKQEKAKEKQEAKEMAKFKSTLEKVNGQDDKSLETETKKEPSDLPKHTTEAKTKPSKSDETPSLASHSGSMSDTEVSSEDSDCDGWSADGSSDADSNADSPVAEPGSTLPWLGARDEIAEGLISTECSLPARL